MLHRGCDREQLERDDQQGTCDSARRTASATDSDIQHGAMGAQWVLLVHRPRVIAKVINRTVAAMVIVDRGSD